MAKAVKTNVLRHLDAEKIPYETRTYTVDDDNYDGKLIAAKVDLPPEMIFKTLVLTCGVKQYLVCVVPVNSELPQKELLPLTGYLRGGCSPIGMKKAFPTWIDKACEDQERISVSAGVRGCQVIMRREDLIRCTRASIADLCRVQD